MKPAYSPDTTSVAFIDPDFNPTGSQNVYPYQLLVEKLDQPLISRRNAIIPPARGFMVSARLLSYYWSPDSTKVFALVDDYSDYFENSLVLRSLVFDLRYGLLLEYDKLYGAYGSLQPQAVWSPDGDRVLIAAPGMLENGEYRLNFFLVFMQPRSLLTLSENVDLAGSAYQYMTNLYWVAPDQ